MFKFRLVVLVAFLALGLAAGCSNDDEGSPMDQGSFVVGLSATAENIGPSDIIFCVDVSDTVSADELKSMVDALGACLANPDLVPQDGTILIGAYVYGDTTAELIAPSTGVDAASLKDIIGPAFQGLLTDRIVGGDGIDLAGAMGMARTALGAATNLDRHVLLMGSGEADDETAVETECDELKNIGVMVSAIRTGSGSLKAFGMCAENTGGFFGYGEGSLDEVCAVAFAYMLQVDIDLEPETAELKRGESHEVMAMVFRGGDTENYPVAGSDVTFMVVDGPNKCDTTTTVATDTTGMAKWSYVGDGGPGIDYVVAETIHPGTDNALTDTVMVEWLNEPPTCEAGGPYEVTVESDSAYVTLDATGSSDLDGDSLTFQWAVDCSDGAYFDDDTAAMPVLMLTGDCLCVDMLTVELTVSDGFDESKCEADVKIVDMRPPVVTLRDKPIQMWPPNHKYHAITPEMFVESIEDACGNPIEIDASVTIVEVSSDEPDDCVGDGKTINDIMIDCPNDVHLRAERMGGMMGRIYTITYRATGANGASVDVLGRVIVPHDMSGGEVMASPEGGYTVAPDCGTDD